MELSQVTSSAVPPSGQRKANAALHRLALPATNRERELDWQPSRLHVERAAAVNVCSSRREPQHPSGRNCCGVADHQCSSQAGAPVPSCSCPDGLLRERHRFRAMTLLRLGLRRMMLAWLVYTLSAMYYYSYAAPVHQGYYQ